MLYRIKQLYSAMTAAVTEEERSFIAHYLNPQEEILFYEMSVVDQRHGLDVGIHVFQRLEDDGLHEREHSLVRAALLHDVGKRHGDLTILDRTLIVFFERFYPGKVARWALEGRGGFIQNRRHAFYVAKYHGMIGAEWLEEVGSPDEILLLVRDHHLTGSEDWRMQLLQEADSIC